MADPTPTQEALSRLIRWRDGQGSAGYVRSLRFLQDVSALVDLVTWRPISEAPRDCSELILGSPDSLRPIDHDEEKWVRGFVREDGVAFDMEGYPLAATHFLPGFIPPPAPISEASHDRSTPDHRSHGAWHHGGQRPEFREWMRVQSCRLVQRGRR